MKVFIPVLLLLCLSNQVQADYVQSFKIKEAIPLNLASRSRGSTLTRDMVLLNTDARVSFKLACVNDSVWKLFEKRFLLVSTSFAVRYDELAAKNLIIDLQSEKSCRDSLDQVVLNPSSFKITIHSQSSAKLEPVSQ